MDKIERMKAVFRGEKPDVTPAGFWFHYNGADSPAQMAENHLSLYRETGMDVIKVMQDYPYPRMEEVQTPSDWHKLRMPGRESAEYRRLEEVLKRILDGSHGEAMVFQTMFGPFKSTVMQFGDARVMAHAQENPAAVAEGVRAVAESLAEWAAGFLEAGASGLYYTAQFGEVGRFSNEEWETLVKPSDLMMLDAAAKCGGKYNILHICGEPEYRFRVHLERFRDYPGDIVNWSVKDNGLSLEDGRALFRRPVLGGMNNKGNLISGTEAEVRAEAEGLIRSFGQAGFMLGADCTVQGKISVANIRAAVEAAHNFRE